MMKWFYRVIQTKVQRARNGFRSIIPTRKTGIRVNEEGVNGETNSLRLRFRSSDDKHIQAKDLREVECKE